MTRQRIIRHRALRRIGLAPLVALALPTMACGPSVPEGVPVETEPRHRLVSERDFAQVLDVQVLGGDTTMFHLHARPMAYVCIRGSEVATQVAGEEWTGTGEPCTPGVSFSMPGYAQTPLTHRLTNGGLDVFHLIGVQSLRDEGARTVLDPAGAGETTVDNGWFRTQTFHLGPGEVTPLHSHNVPTLIVLAAGAGGLSAIENGPENVLVEEGAWLWHEPGRHTLASTDGLELRIVEIEVK